MCWSKKVSLTTFIIALVGVIYLYKRNKPNDRWVALFAGTVAIIQLAEYFMWDDLKCGNKNKYASMFALLILALEPLMAMVGGIYLSHTPYKNALRGMLIVYIVFIAFVYFMNYHQQKIDWCGTTSCDSQTIGKFFGKKTCALQWKFTRTISPKMAIIWVLFLAIPFLTMKPLYQGIVLILVGGATMYMARTANNAARSSLWCWFSIIIIFVKIIM